MKYFYFCLLLLINLPLPGQKQLDLIITNGRIVDGSGNSWFYGDIGIRKGKISEIGDLGDRRAKARIDAGNQIVAPGFIDVHGHLEYGIRKHPNAENFLYDGVTTVITGNCGNSSTELETFFRELEQMGISLNIASLIGHNAVRRAVMGEAQRAPTSEELGQMEALVDRAMRAGAVGFSTGLIYVPGTYAETSEVVALAKVAADHRGIYASHIRNENNEIVAAIEEAVNIGREANMPVQISHFKLGSRSMWDKSHMTVGLIDKYRAAGIDVTVDQYPYTASSTTLSVTLPSWALAGGTDSLSIRLADADTKARIISEMKDILDRKGFADYEYAAIATCPWNSDYNGKRIPEVTTMMERPGDLDSQIETILEMVAKGPRVQMVFHAMDERDVKRIMRYPFAMVASDAGVIEFGSGMPHPRAYGTNSRVLARYVREQQNLRLEEAIRKMTSLPAQRFHLSDRGLLRPGMAADIVIFDPEKVSDEATFEAPHAYATGFSYVLVNGQAVIRNGQHSGLRSGQVLRPKW